ncbi:MAG: MBL fold metallo-hydrolase [Chloroflexia bacterium]|nr:MBL fold metallo-hydrolase [Chloroflexia bacterium]
MGGAGEHEEWFRVSEPEPGVFAIEEPHHFERVASYLIVGSERAVLLDTGMGVAPLRPLVEALTDKPLRVLLSHAHFDHIGGTHEFAGSSPILIHELEAPKLRSGLGPEYLTKFYGPESLSGPLPAGFDPENATIPGVEPTALLRGGESIDLGDRVLDVLFCPGHAAGLLALLDRGRRALYSTDVAYAGALYAHLPGVDLAAYRETLATLAHLVPDLDRLYPAHNQRPLPAAYLSQMSRAIDAILAGRAADEARSDADVHRFDGFSVLVPPSTGAAEA